jgi:hypothetical protein
MACTVAEFVRWLPGATAGHALALDDGAASVTIGRGRLKLAWCELPPRRIALVVLPRLQVRFEFDAVDDAQRLRFMRHFDLYTQRGGG